MYIQKVEVKNFRLLIDAAIELDHKSTVLVGKNNCGKTSLMDLLEIILNDSNSLSFNDYPICKRNTLYENIQRFYRKRISFDELKQTIELPKAKFYISYELENPDADLGTLSPFIIDIDESITTVIIQAEYEFIVSEDVFNNYLINLDFDNAETINEQIRGVFYENYISFYKLNVYSIHPTNDEIKSLMNYSDLQKLIPLYKISAERALDESETQDNKPLKSLMTALFKSELDDSLQTVEDKIKELKEKCNEVKTQSQAEINDLLSDIVKQSFVFGYPSAEELQLTAKTSIELEKQIQSSANLYYVNKEASEMLPSTYNGLGYKNLIKIELKLIDFTQQLRDNQKISIPIIYIEEPEAHMHPQMQQRFIEYIDDFCSKLGTDNIQVIITSHSSHIVNSTDFSKIRYIKKKENLIEIKNLNDFCNNDKVDYDTKNFLKKYLTLNKCDLFFCDKAILIEGTAERLLIPDMINKLKVRGKFLGNITLDSQYYTLVEVGGAYAFRFFPLLEFLDIPALIITDIDAIDVDRKKCLVTNGSNTSNATIKYWFNNYLSITTFALNDIKALDSDKKTCNSLHLEYQVEEGGLCGRSLEEAIKNANRTLYGLANDSSEDDLLYDASNDGSKTDFAMDLLFNTSKSDYSVPKYIENGLIWLNDRGTNV